MHEFIAKHQDKIAGTLSGFDRLVFRGHLRSIGHPQGMMNYLWTNQILLKNFGAHVGTENHALICIEVCPRERGYEELLSFSDIFRKLFHFVVMIAGYSMK